MSKSLNSFGKPVFADGTDFVADLQAAADFADTFANLRRGTAAQRGALVAGQLRPGLLFSETDTGNVWWYSGSTWSLLAGPLPFLVVRSTTQQALADATWATLTGWATPSTARGITFDTSTGIVTIARAGVYELDGFVSINAGGAAGNRVSRFTLGGTADANAIAYSLLATAGSVTLPVRRTLPLAVSDQIRFQALEASGGALNTIVGNNPNGYETRLSVRFLSET